MIKRGNSQYILFLAFVKPTWRRTIQTWCISVQGHTLWPKPCSNKSTLHKDHLLMNQSRQQTLSKFHMKYIPRCTQHSLPIMQTDLQCCQLSHSINLLLQLNIKTYWAATAISLAHPVVSEKTWKQGHNGSYSQGIQIHCTFFSSKYFFRLSPLWAWK